MSIIDPASGQTNEPEISKTSIYYSLNAEEQLRVNLALGILALYATITILIIVNYIVYNVYNPDIQAILDRIVPMSICPVEWFAPEPVERTQFQLSLLLIPFLILGIYRLCYNARAKLANNLPFCVLTNISGIGVFLYYLTVLFGKKLIQLPKETTAYFFKDNVFSLLGPVAGAALYTSGIALLYYFSRKQKTTGKNLLFSAISYGIVAFTIMDIYMYNVVHASGVDLDNAGEMNPVFYSITQVYAGKSLLVNINCQYGLFAWFLSPVFHLIGLSIYKIAMTLAALTCLSFLFIFLAIKKLIKHEVFSLLTFLCLVFWQFWHVRVPLQGPPVNYFQYWPSRFLFPSLCFFLVVTYQNGTGKAKKILLPILCLCAAFAVLWNLDTGVVVFGATALALVAASINPLNLKDSLLRSITMILWMLGSLVFAVCFFIVATKLHSGLFPQFAKFTSFQNVFYISGFFMLPMSAIHFWNIPILVYIIACIYCVHMISKNDTYEMPVITFLVILGFGIFAYFQGRSYDLAVNGIMYPSIVLIGLFSKKLFFYILPFKKKLHEGTVIVLMPLIFICDGAASMVYHTRSIHHYAKANWASPIDHYESDLSKKLQFIEHSIAPKDTVLIIAKNYESFYYAAGGYYNPLDLPGSTELFFKAEIDTLKDYIKRCRYPIIFEPTLSWPYLDTIMHTLSEYTVVQSRLENFNLLLLKPVEKIRHKLSIDTNTILYDANGYFSRYLQPLAPITLPENYDIELIISAEKSTLDSDKVVCCNPSQNYPFRGIFIKQEASNPLEYLFAFGDGKSWCSKAKFKLDAKRINDILISVRKDKITIYNNNSLCAEANTDCQIMNSDGNFLFNSTYMGVVNEIRISAQ